MQRIKLLHLISRIDPGGAENQLLNLLSNLDKEKYDVCMGYFQGDGGLRQEFQNNKIRVKKFRFRGLQDLLAWRQLYRDFKVNRYDIIHTHGFKADLQGAVIGRLTAVPVIISTVHNQEAYLKNPLIKILERYVISYINDAIIVVSDGVKRFLIKTAGIKGRKIKKVYYGINPLDIKADKDRDIRREFGIDKDAPLVGCIGRLVEQKGHIYLIQAAGNVIESFPKARFLIVGRGALDKKLKKIVKRLGLSRHIIFTGFRKDIYGIINKLDLLVMPSLWEGLGLVLLEAMALAKPIIATNVGGIPEAVKDKKTGILVEPRDSKALANAIICLLKDFSLAKKMAEEGKLLLKERFSLDRMARETEAVYNDTLKLNKNCGVFLDMD